MSVLTSSRFEIKTKTTIMKTEELNNKGQTLAPYASPSVKVIDINAQDMLCQSGSSITGLNLLEDDSDNWN